MEFKSVEKLPIDVKESIKNRVSTRSFEDKSLTDNDKTKLMDFSNLLTNPFDVDVKVQYISKEHSSNDVKLGTYGTIKGAKDFLAITVKDQSYAMEAVGYQIENLILYATDMGLGTVWLAATFSRKDFENVMDIASDDLFPCISPIGYPAEKHSLIEKITRAGLGSKNRKTWYKLPLEMLRLAPSSTNAQPWSVVKEGNSFHFFCNYKDNTGDDMKKIKNLDLGIALSHFHQTAMSEGLNGKFELKDIDFSIPEHSHYVISYVAE